MLRLNRKNLLLGWKNANKYEICERKKPERKKKNDKLNFRTEKNGRKRKISLKKNNKSKKKKEKI